MELAGEDISFDEVLSNLTVGQIRIGNDLDLKSVMEATIKTKAHDMGLDVEIICAEGFMFYGVTEVMQKFLNHIH